MQKNKLGPFLKINEEKQDSQTFKKNSHGRLPNVFFFFVLRCRSDSNIKELWMNRVKITLLTKQASDYVILQITVKTLEVWDERYNKLILDIKLK